MVGPVRDRKIFISPTTNTRAQDGFVLLERNHDVHGSTATDWTVRTLNLAEAAAFLRIHKEELRVRAKRGSFPALVWAVAGYFWSRI